MSRTIVNPDETALHSAAKERFDELKINFLARHKDTVKSVLFLGMSRGAGASTAASNFARSLARDREMRVLLINADLRASELAGADTSITQNSSAPSEVGKVHVLPGMRVLADPAVLFQSKRFTAFMAQCAQQYDYVVIDGPPLDEAPESIALCTSVDGVVLVLDAQRTRRKGALRAKQRIEEVGGRILGVALNRRKFFIPQWLYRLIY
jgi:Mrp family chromosome partitioning ATPase